MTEREKLEWCAVVMVEQGKATTYGEAMQRLLQGEKVTLSFKVRPGDEVVRGIYDAGVGDAPPNTEPQ